jgi:signal transduction histidine kinase
MPGKPNRESLLHRYGDQLGRIVQRNRAEMALLAAKQEAERSAALARSAMIEAQTANRAKTQFLANMSHELRTPLNAIIGFADVLRAGESNPDSRLAEYADYIYGSGCHLLSIINDILDLSRLESGRQPLTEEVLALQGLIDSCLSIMGRQIDEAGLTIESATAPGLPDISGDARMLKQVIAHLLSNAVKFTPRGGRVRIDAGLSEGGDPTLAVSDTGIGIAPEHLDRVMAPFWQVDGDLNRVSTGTGLGLPLAKALAEAHGGRLAVASAIGVGTCVTVTLPAARCRPGARWPGTADAAAFPAWTG